MSVSPEKNTDMTDVSPDVAYSSAFTYAFLKDVKTTGLDRPSKVVIPRAALEAMTGMERQYWDIKKEHFDVVLFFKKGKFYELYDCDAVISTREFGLKMSADFSNRKMRMSGVPEQSFADWSRLFVFKGYKVGRVEQMAVDEAMIAANGGKEPKCIPRELVAILTRGTLTEANAVSGAEPLYVMALHPAPTPENPSAVDAVAVDLTRRAYWHCPCANLTDLATLLHHMHPAEVVVEADANAAASSEAPAGAATRAVLASMATDMLPECHVERVAAASKSAAGGSSSTPVPPSWRLLHAYFTYLKMDVAQVLPSSFPHLAASTAGDSDDGATLDCFGEYSAHRDRTANAANAPQVPLKTTSVLMLERRADEGLMLDAAAIESLDLVANSRDQSASSTLMSWLEQSGGGGTPGGRRLLRQWLLRPSACAGVIRARQAAVAGLSGVGGVKATLRAFMDEWATLTPRQAQSGAAAIDTSALLAAAAASGDGEEGGDETAAATTTVASGRPTRGLGSLNSLSAVDFERLLARLNEFRTENTRVTFTTPLVHYQKNLTCLDQTLRGFELLDAFAARVAPVLQQLAQQPEEASADAATLGDADALPTPASGAGLLLELVRVVEQARAPLRELVAKFDRAKITREGNMLLPVPGQNQTYDEAVGTIKAAEQQLALKLRDLRKQFGDASLSYCDLGKELFLLELPSKYCSPAAMKTAGIEPGELVERARTTKVVKFAVTSLAPIIAAHKKATTTKELAIVATLRELAAGICARWAEFFSAARAAAYIDCMCALSRSAQEQACTGDVCFPRFADSEPGAPVGVALQGVCHPVVRQTRGSCVPNDIYLGTAAVEDSDGRVLILTGPNMAGKSTLMRTAAVAILLAQIGGAVCAKSARISGGAVDRIFTRIGARDATHRGQSTLFVELAETAEILRQATSRSLCLIDELGRGTSTHDGFAIAHAALIALTSTDEAGNDVGRARPLVLFATHYHALALEMSIRRQENRAWRSAVQLGYMDFVSTAVRRRRAPTEAEAAQGAEEEDEVQRDVTFLHRLVKGICARSYGAEVALKAGLPLAIVQRARLLSGRMAATSVDMQLVRFAEHLKAGPTDAAATKFRAAQLVALARAATATS